MPKILEKLLPCFLLVLSLNKNAYSMSLSTCVGVFCLGFSIINLYRACKSRREIAEYQRKLDQYKRRIAQYRERMAQLEI